MTQTGSTGWFEAGVSSSGPKAEVAYFAEVAREENRLRIVISSDKRDEKFFRLVGQFLWVCQI
jgi:hypothetical protein